MIFGGAFFYETPDTDALGSNNYGIIKTDLIIFYNNCKNGIISITSYITTPISYSDRNVIYVSKDLGISVRYLTTASYNFLDNNTVGSFYPNASDAVTPEAST